MRSYDLSYAAEIYPDHTWDAGGKSFGISTIQETGLDSQTRPATSFTYDDMHLVEADNGFGGTVEYEYESDPWAEIVAEEDDYIHTTPDGSCPYAWNGDVDCEGNPTHR